MKIVIAGGSVAGLACAHALLNIKCDHEIMVLEKSRSLTPAGAGLALETQVCKILEQWDLKQSIHDITLPLSIEEYRVSENERRTYKMLVRDNDCKHRATNWSQLHRTLYESLPNKNVFKWGHELISFCNKNDGSGVSVQVKVVAAQQVFNMDCDLLVGADGIKSTVSRILFPDVQRRYLGYCAVRGVYEYGDESSEIATSLRALYPDLGKCLYFEIAKDAHALFFQIGGKRINWVYFQNQPEIELKGNSLTVKLDEVEIKKMHKYASETWMPELAAVMKATPEPFLNVIYDRDPLKQLVVGRVALVGDAAHPTSPHCARSTNMSIIDAATLATYVQKWGSDLETALAEYESARLHVTSKQVLHSRDMGFLKQGRLYRSPDWPEVPDTDQCNILLLRNVPLKSLQVYVPKMG